MSLQDKINSVSSFKDSLGENLIGIEKEGLRVAKDGSIAQTPHPESFGSALTHPPLSDASFSLKVCSLSLSLSLSFPPAPASLSHRSLPLSLSHPLNHARTLRPSTQDIWTCPSCIVPTHTPLAHAEASIAQLVRA